MMPSHSFKVGDTIETIKEYKHVDAQILHTQIGQKGTIVRVDRFYVQWKIHECRCTTSYCSSASHFVILDRIRLVQLPPLKNRFENIDLE